MTEKRRTGRVVAISGLLIAAALAVVSALLFKDAILEFLGLSSSDPIRVFSGPPGEGVRSVAFLGDAGRVASATDDGSVRLWEVENGREILVLAGHQGRVYDVAVAADDRSLISGGHDGTVRLWDAASGQARWVYSVTKTPVRTVALSPDGKLALSSTAMTGMNSIHVADATTGRLLMSRGQPAPVHAASFSEDGSRIISGGEGASLVIWNAQNSGVIHELAGHEGSIADVCFSPDGRLSVSVGEDKLLHVWDADTGKEQRTLRGHGGPIRSVAISPDSKRALSASTDGTMRLWDLVRGKQLRRYDHTDSGTKIEVWSVAFSPDGRLAISGGADGKIRLWELP